MRTVPLPGRTDKTAQLERVVVDFTPAERDAIDAHASALGLSPDQYIRQAAAERALIWQREREALQAVAQRRGCTVKELVERGSLIEAGL
ncbi:plasmid mobilization protein [Streptomyces sp. NPDC048291]|uniref:plasmid mobilization protein n=1 Tax=Streptomyces sp. NPDC048291 TaxID=3365530 RepID=UPI00371BDDCA